MVFFFLFLFVPLFAKALLTVYVTLQARLCCKRCGHIIGLGPYCLSMTSLPFALVAMTGFSSSHFCFVSLISASFAICHCSPGSCSSFTIGSIAWSVHALVMYKYPMPLPSKLQLSLLGYFPGYTRLPLVISSCPVDTSSHLFSPHPACAWQSSSIASCIT